MTKRQVGIVEIVLSGFFFGFLGIFGKLAYAHSLSPGELLSFRFLISSLVLFIFLKLTKPQLLSLNKSTQTKAILLGVFGYAVFSSCYFSALEGLSASLTVLLLYLYPVMVSLGARLLFREHLNLFQWTALPLSCLGMLLLVWGDLEVRQSHSLYFGIASAFFYAVYILTSRSWLKSTHPLSSVLYVQIGAAITLNILHFKSFERSLDIFSNTWPLLIAIAILSTLLPMLLFLSGLQKLSSTETSLLSTTEPLTAMMIAALFLGERLSLIQCLGGALVICALVLTTYKKTTRQNS